MTDGTLKESKRGMRGTLGRLGAALGGLLQTRIELIAIEYSEERARMIEALVLVVVAVVFLAFAILAASALVVAWFWDTHRIAALFGVTMTYTLVGMYALWRLSQSRAADAKPFAGTLAEFERDRAWLADNFGADP